MPQTTVSPLFTGSLGSQMPQRLVGLNAVPFTDTVPTTAIDEIADIRKFVPLPVGAVPILVYLENADLDTGTSLLRTDLIQIDDAATVVLVSDGSGLLAAPVLAGAGKWYLLNTSKYPAVPAGQNAAFGFKVTAVANVAAAGIVKGVLYFI